MEWVVAHLAEIGLAIMVLDRIAAATPEDLRILHIPIGKWDNQVVDFIKFVVKSITGGNGKNHGRMQG